MFVVINVLFIVCMIDIVRRLFGVEFRRHDATACRGAVRQRHSHTRLRVARTRLCNRKRDSRERPVVEMNIVFVKPIPNTMSDDDDDGERGAPRDNKSSSVTNQFAARLAVLSGGTASSSATTGGGGSLHQMRPSASSNQLDELIVNDSDEDGDFDSLRGEILTDTQAPADKKPLVVREICLFRSLLFRRCSVCVCAQKSRCS